ncbi:MAG: hypothetical protein KF764_18625 [Labilithrix sp.]|nr:hypothetical protein [Labilithrix sp.]MBX3223688.1 hypothetical protein [Labilithrix sp.]
MKRALTTLAATLFGASLLACPGPKMPSGPPPEYEEPPPPSWLDSGAAAPAVPEATPVTTPPLDAPPADPVPATPDAGPPAS